MTLIFNDPFNKKSKKSTRPILDATMAPSLIADCTTASVPSAVSVTAAPTPTAGQVLLLNGVVCDVRLSDDVGSLLCGGHCTDSNLRRRHRWCRRSRPVGVNCRWYRLVGVNCQCRSPPTPDLMNGAFRRCHLSTACPRR